LQSKQQQQQQQQKQQQMQRQMQKRPVPPNINVFSPQYARYVGAKPTTSSIQIGLGGVSPFLKQQHVRY